MPVAPDAVRETIVLEEPRADEQPEPQGAQAAGTGAAESLSRTRRLLLAGVCVAAFLVGFAVVTVLMHDAGSASKPRSKTTPTSVAPSAPAPAPS
ncbi:MAG TPA: hypothetical protein VKC65_00310, partial [Gaiellaceae bacterium]|nr:hypothetical protein [Gaiellaceae bacterium]